MSTTDDDNGGNNLIAELRQKLDKKDISARELLEQYIARARKTDPTVGAFLHVNNEAGAAADAAQKQIDAGQAGIITGIPIGLKDNLCTVDMPTTCASRMLQGFVPPYDATVVKKLRDQRAVFVGKLNMDEFAMGATTATSYYKKTKNPFNLSCVPGGSSGGSAAAVSAGMVVAALGSDTGGSVRQPAAFCGVTGLRPTYGMVSRYGCVAFASALDQVGPIATSAQDCAYLLSAIAGKDDYDQTSQNSPSFAPKALEANVAGKRFGLIKELMDESLVEAETVEAVKRAALWFQRNGATVDEVSLPLLKYAVPSYYLISSAEASANLSRFDGVRYGYRPKNPATYDELVTHSRHEGFGWEVKRRVMLGCYALCSGYYDDYYKRATRLANVIRSDYARAFETFDALISPTSPNAAFPFDDVPSDPSQLYLADVCTVSAALAGLPAVSTPCGYTGAGLPVGLMITGDAWGDANILSYAAAFEGEFERRTPVLEELGA